MYSGLHPAILTQPAIPIISMICKITNLRAETLLLRLDTDGESLCSGLQMAILTIQPAILTIQPTIQTINMNSKVTDLRAETFLLRLGIDGEGLYSGLQTAVLLHRILVLFTGQRQVMFQLLQADLPA